MKRPQDNGKRRAAGHTDGNGARPSVAKVSHTLDVDLADRLEEFAFRQRFSESAVIEFALLRFFEGGDDEDLGRTLRESGAGRRRRV